MKNSCKVLSGRSGAEVTGFFRVEVKVKILNTELHRGRTESHRKKLFLPIVAVHHTLDSVTQVGYVEVDEKTYPDSAQPQIRKKLGMVDRMDCFDRLHFYDYQIFYQQVDAITEFNLFTVEDHWQTDLAGNAETAFFQIVGETALICAFQQARPEHRMDVHGGGNDSAGDLVDAKTIAEGSCGGHYN